MSKTKYCDVGNHEVEKLWHSKRKDRPSCCQSCLKREPIRNDKVKVDTKVTEGKKVAVRSAIKPKHYVIPKVSKNRQEALKTYRRRRDKYFDEHPVCEFPECTSKDITLHHMKGRIGAFLADKRYFKSLCHKHHRYVEENPLEAQKLGLSFKRLDK